MLRHTSHSATPELDRRGFIVAASGLATASVLPEPPPEIDMAFLLTLRVQVQAPVGVGTTPEGTVSVHTIRGGSFEGPQLRGEILSGGGDWLRGGSDGVGRLNVRMVLRADDQATILVRLSGVLFVPPEAAALGRQMTADDYYFRCTPTFETASETHGWLNRVVAVGKGDFSSEPGVVRYDIAQIL